MLPLDIRKNKQRKSESVIEAELVTPNLVDTEEREKRRKKKLEDRNS